MGDNQPVFGSLQPPIDERPSRIPIFIGAAVVLAGIAILVLVSRGSQTSATDQTEMAPPEALASELAISDLAMSTADNFAGATVTYVEGKIQNKGTHTFQSITLQAGFRDQVGQLVQKDALPLAIITAREPYVDTGSLSTSPLKPGETKEFRLAFDHISEQWNQNYPELRVIRTATQ